jgi:hypothetical protein
MQAGLVNHVGWFTTMWARQPFKLINHAGCSTKQAGKQRKMLKHAGFSGQPCRIVDNHAGWSTMHVG